MLLPSPNHPYQRSDRGVWPQGAPGSLAFMPEADDDQTTAPRRVFSAYGVASAVLGLLAVVAIVLGTLIWSGHRNATDERAYQTRVMPAAADWTGC